MAINEIHIFPASGYRGPADGKLYASGTHGFSWSSTPNGSSFAWSLDFLSGSVLVYSNFNFSYGFPVRCVQASATVFAFTNDTFVFFPVSGKRGYLDGRLYSLGLSGYGWSSTPNGSSAWSLDVWSSGAHMLYDIRGYGFPVRCVQASVTTVFAFTNDTFVFFPASGYRSPDAGKLINSGTWGYEWASTLGASGVWGLNFSPAGLGLWDFGRGCGFPVRCVQASAAVFVFIRKEIEETSVFFPAAGFRGYSDGKLYYSGTYGYMWTSTPNGSSTAYYLRLYSGDACVYNDSRAYGFSVRCVQASATVWAVQKENIRQIRFRRESGKVRLCRRGRADSVTHLGRKLSVGHSLLPCAASSYLFTLIKLPVFECLYFYKHSSGYFLFFPASGYRNFTDGKLSGLGASGYGWTSSSADGVASSLLLYSAAASMYDYVRNDGFSVRCVQASAAVIVFIRKDIEETFFFPASGFRGGGSLYDSGTGGYGWTSTPNGSNAYYLLLYSGDVLMLYDLGRKDAFPVRCVQASATVWAIQKENIRQIRFRRESGKACLCRRGHADSVTRLGRKLSVGHFLLPCAVPSYLFAFIKLPVLNGLYFYKHYSGYFLFFPATGYRHSSNGNFYSSGIWGYGWTSTLDSGNVWHLDIHSGNAYMLSYGRGFGFPVRCVQASVAVFVFVRKDIEKTFVFFPAAGYRNVYDGVLQASGGWGDTWSSTTDGSSQALFLCSYSGLVKMSTDNRGFGMSVRCVQASATVWAVQKENIRQIRFRRESGKACFCRRGRADSVTYLGRKLSVRYSLLPCAAPSYSISLVKLPVLNGLYFYKHSSGYSLFFPATGNRNGSGGGLTASGLWGLFWTATPSDGRVWAMEFNAAAVVMYGDMREHGFSVRCVQASASVFVFVRKDIEKTFVFFPAAGYRDIGDGKLYKSGGEGDGWASPSTGGSASFLRFQSGIAHVQSADRAFGLSVRCVQASATVWTFQKENIRQIRFRRESGKACFCRRGRADSVTRLGRKLSVGHSLLPCAAPSYSISLIELPVLNGLYFYKYSSGYFFFFPASGFREYSDGSLRAWGVESTGWSSTPEGANACRLLCGSGYASVYGIHRDYGFPVRCVQASAAVFVFVRKDIEKTFVFFPAAGNRDFSGGYLKNSGVSGYAWTSTPDSSSAYNLDFYAGYARVGGNLRSYGFPVRCVQASAAVFAFTKDTLCFFPAAGDRQYSVGRLDGSGSFGFGWTSTPDGSSNAWNFYTYSGNAFMGSNHRGYGFSVRCVQASASVFAFTKDTLCFFPATGYRHYSAGNLHDSGVGGYEWTSVPADGGFAWRLVFHGGAVEVGSIDRTYGFAVRCVQASAAVWAIQRQNIKQIRFRRESGKVRLCRRGQADSVTRLGRKLSVGHSLLSCAVPSYSISLIKLPVFAFLYFYKHSSGYFLFFPASGFRYHVDGSLRDSGRWGFGWSSTPGDGRAWALEFVSTLAHIDALFRTYGFPVRCVQAPAPIFAFIKDTFCFFPASGYHEFSNGAISSGGSWGYGWTSALSGSGDAWLILLYSGGAYMNGLNRGYGFSVRCVQASAPIFAFTKDTFCFFPASGYRHYGSGKLGDSGSWGFGWSSTTDGSSHTWGLNFGSGYVSMYNYVCGYGFPVRCVQASATVWAVQKENIKQIRYRRESGKARLCRRGHADSVTRLGRKLSVGHSLLSCAASSYLFTLIKLPVLNGLYFYKHFSGYFLFFPAAGYRFASDGSLRALGTWGYGWSSTPNGGVAEFLWLSPGTTIMSGDIRSHGFSVRCVQVSVAVFVFIREDFRETSVFFPASGHRYGGVLSGVGSGAYAWSSTPGDSNTAWDLNSYSGPGAMYPNNRTYGFPVRCVQASAAVFAFVREDFKETSVFFPASGYRHLSDGTLVNSSTWGYGWTSTPNDGNAWYLNVYSGGALVYANFRTYGFPVRCVQASVPVFVFTKDTFCFFPASGVRSFDAGILYNGGVEGDGWASTPDVGGRAWYLYFSSEGLWVSLVPRGYGFPVRCVQASATVWIYQEKGLKQIRFRRESGKACLCRRGRADSVTRLGRKLSVGHSLLPCAVPSYSISLIELPVLNSLYFYKYSSGYFLFFPAAGYRSHINGSLVLLGSSGYAWTSSVNSGNAWDLDVSSGGAFTNSHDRANSFSVRCVQASATVFIFNKETFVFFPASGFRNGTDGTLREPGVSGYGWTSTLYVSGRAYTFLGYGGTATVGHDGCTYGFPVRCVQASAAVWAVRKENTKQIRFRRESGKASLYRRGQADSVTRLGRKLSVGHFLLPCAAPSYSISLMELLVLNSLYFYKHFSGYFFFFPASGGRGYGIGELYNSGTWGCGWSSTSNGSNAYYLFVDSGAAYMSNNNRAYGFSVRCVQASAAVFVFVIKEFKETPDFFFPASGFRNYVDGSLLASGTGGFGWSSTSLGSDVWYFECRSSVARMFAGPRGYDFPVRCVQASATVWAVQKENIKQIRFRRESGKARLCRRGRADSVTRLERKLSIGHSFLPYAVPSYSISLIELPVLNSLYFYKYSSGYFLFFPAAGYRHYSLGELFDSGTHGYEWTSLTNNSLAWFLDGWSTNAQVRSANRDFGFSVRCVQASAAVFVFIRKDIKETLFFFPATGHRNSGDGKLYGSGMWGYEWTDTQNGGNAWHLGFHSGGADMGSNHRGFGFPVRCVQASATVWAVQKENIKQIRYRRESGKACLCRRGRADSVTRLGRKLSVGHSLLPCAVPSYSISLIKLLVFECLYFYKYSSGYFFFFPASGNRSYTAGSLINSGRSGYGWTATPVGSNAWYLDVWSGSAHMLDNVSRGFGFPVRCVQASATVFIFNKETFVFFPASGYHDPASGIFYASGSRGYGWSSTPNSSSDAQHLHFYSAGAFMGTFRRAAGFPVRCVQASAAVFGFIREDFKETSVFFPASGARLYSDGSLRYSGTSAIAWTSTVKDSNAAWYLDVNSPGAHVPAHFRTYGFSVRCVQASAPVFAFTNDTFVFFPAAGYRFSSSGSLVALGSRGYGWGSDPYDGSRAWGLFLGAEGTNMYYDSRAYGFSVRCVQASAAVSAFIKEAFVFFPAAGKRGCNDGKLYSSGLSGHGWSSTPNGSSVWSLGVWSSGAHVYNDNRGYGFSVRCVQASAAVWVVRKENTKQIRYRRESGKGILCRRGRADSVTCLGRKLFASANRFVCVVPSYSISLIELPAFKCPYFYKHSSGYFLFFPASGHRSATTGELTVSGSRGDVLSSTTSGATAWYLYFSSGAAYMSNYERVGARSVRCVQASAIVFAFTERIPADFFPASGYRHHGDGKLYLSGTNGYVWSSTLIGGKAYNLTFGSGGANMHPNENRGHGFSVRCVQASAIVFVCMVLLLKINTMENDTS